jgi:hypothetical protein
MNGRLLRAALYVSLTPGLYYSGAPLVAELSADALCCKYTSECLDGNVCCSPCPRMAECASEFPNYCETPTSSGHCAAC